ncbi:hypothetical protein FA95DRAFT_412185 [Auriscalpium vulgare]|uniref:Uncharacterized protein n=1 Tax=Auriscalpium vulgare TaxID=40419 RepID=A0ACB8RH73_9AGAM|nr:hypothetical protein FA95DRAFT_412185 [Auriscalpium vulgare]
MSSKGTPTPWALSSETWTRSPSQPVPAITTLEVAGQAYKPKPGHGAAPVTILATTLAILKEIVDAANSLPYVKAVAGIVLKIIELKDNLDKVHARWEVVMDKVKLLAQIICDAYEFPTHFGTATLPSDIFYFLETAESNLQEVIGTMKQQHKQKKSWIAPILAGNLTDEINKCDGLVSNIIQKYEMSMIFSIRCHQHTGSLSTLVFHFIHIIETLKGVAGPRVAKDHPNYCKRTSH